MSYRPKIKNDASGTLVDFPLDAETVSGHTVLKDVPANAVFTDNNDNQKVKAGSITFGDNDVVNFAAGNNVTVTGNATNKTITIAATDTTYESKAAAQGGTAVSLVTTGEKYTWNSKQNALETQTAYTSKGSATKVPQITTNTLGQVTGITEVDITAATDNSPRYGKFSSGGKAKRIKKIDTTFYHWYYDSDEGRNMLESEESIGGEYVWTDGNKIYYSDGNTQFYLNKNIWETMTWSGLTNFYGEHIWTDGTTIYYSNGTTHYYLDGTTWRSKSWSGLTNFDGQRVWTDGFNIYYSQGTSHYVLNTSTSTWSVKTWSGLTNFYGQRVWSYGNKIYYSDGSSQYVLKVDSNVWEPITWVMDDKFTGDGIKGNKIWSDGENIYYSDDSLDYGTWMLNTAGDGLHWYFVGSGFLGEYLWSDGIKFYYSYSNDTQQEIKISDTAASCQSKTRNNDKREFDILWTNDDPFAWFYPGAGTWTVPDMSKYQYLRIEYRITNSDSFTLQYIDMRIEYGRWICIDGRINSDTYARVIMPYNKTTMKVEHGVINGTGSSSNDYAIIPFRISGFN